MSKSVKRLFESFKPESYHIDLKISEDKKSFSGNLVLKGFKQGRPSSRITLHQKGLKINNPKLIKIEKSTKIKIPIKRFLNHDAYDELRLHTESTLYPGNYVIELEFSGKITKNMDGVYPCFFEDNGKNKEIIATQFESHHAREAFPCIDEPEAKATFELTLTHNKNEIALSNTMPVKESVNGKQKTTKFGQTPIMSTYLLAFVIGELEVKESKSKSGVLLRAFATKNQIEYTDFALETAVKCLDFYEEYFDIPYPLEKCDFVALPDFASGAMENWGLITFREHVMLVEEDNTSLSTKQYVAIVVAHELTHQWFGNLVTMRWWTDLWLNEGFASWMEYLAVDHLFPEWKMWTQFTVDDQQLAMKSDGLEHTHPIEVPVKHPDEIRTIFDVISYNKGSSVIHMLNNYLGEKSFRDGLRHYLKKFSYKNTDTVDLWQALEDISKKPVKDFMDAWTTKSGFPLVTISQKDDHLIVSQNRFVYNPKSESRNDKTLWPIPLLAQNLDRPIVNKKSTNVPIKGKTPVKINDNQTGFYRVDYSHKIQKEQIKAIKNGKLSSLDRMGLLSDGLEITKAGYQSIEEYLDLLENFKEEDSLSTWEIIGSSIGLIKNVLSKNDKDDTLRDALKPFTNDLISKQLKRLTWEESDKDTHLDKLLRPIIISLAANADNQDIISETKIAYKNKIENNLKFNPNLRTIIYVTNARLGGDKEFNELLNLYNNSNSSDEKLSLTAALTSFEKPEIHKKALDLITSDTVRLQDIGYWIAYSFMNRHARSDTWQWLKDNWQWLKENLGTDLSFSRTPVYVARNMSDKDFLKDFKAFFEPLIEPSIERSYNQSIEMIETNIDWRKRDSQAALAWFSKNK